MTRFILIVGGSDSSSAADAGRTTAVLTDLSLSVGGTTTLTVTAKNASGTPLSVGGDTVAVTGNNGHCTASAVTDHSNGSYTFVITAASIGTTIFTVTINGVHVTGSSDPTEEVISTPWFQLDFGTDFADDTTMKSSSLWSAPGDTVWGAIGDGAYLKSGVTGYNGRTKALRYDFADQTAHSSSRCHDYSPATPNITLPAPVAELWLEVWSKFDASFTTATPSGWNCISARAYKYIHTRIQSTPAWEYVVGNPDDSSIDVNIIGVNEFTFGITNIFTPSRYIRHRIHQKCASGGNAICKWEIDGVLICNKTGISTSTSLIYGVGLGRNINRGPSQLTGYETAIVTGWNTNPGWL